MFEIAWVSVRLLPARHCRHLTLHSPSNVKKREAVAAAV
jgi:hypothetical protein